MIKSNIYKYVFINLLINLTLFILLFFAVTIYFEHKKQKIIDGVKRQIYEDISYNLALPDYVEVQRQINSARRPEIIGIVVIDKFGKNIWSNGKKQEISKEDITQNIIYDGREVGLLGIALDNVFFKTNLKKMALIMLVCHFFIFILSIYIIARIHAKKIEELEWEKGLSERRLQIVGKLAACITRQLKQPIMEMEKNFGNSKYATAIRTIQKFIDRIERVAVVVPDDDIEDINDYVDDVIVANEKIDRMKKGVEPIPIFSGKYYKSNKR